MNINTEKFGEITIDENLIFDFVEPIIGYENNKKYVLVEHAENSAFKWLQSIEDAALAFPVSSPAYFDIDYQFEIPTEIAEKINSSLKFRGMWFFQVKENSMGELALLEIAPRIAGTMGMYRGLGVNFILLALYDAMGIDVSVINNNFDIEIDRALFARYKHNIEYETVYIDFDDTILLGDKVNSGIMQFLYQAKNKNKKIILITKHEKNVEESLTKYFICEHLFDEIIHLDKNQKKSDFIKDINSIFIDDSYAERQNVSKNIGIPVFGIDAIEVLLDFKR